MKQTAVEFYAEQEVKLTLDFLANKINQVEYGIKRVKLIEQAKEKEIEQRKNDFRMGWDSKHKDLNREFYLTKYLTNSWK